MPGRKSLSCCPVVVCAAVGTTWEASKLGGLNIKECLQPRKDPRERLCSRIKAGSRPYPFQGKADDTGEETGKRTLWDRRGMGPSIRGKIRRITSGRAIFQQGLETTCKDSPVEAKAEDGEREVVWRMSP